MYRPPSPLEAIPAPAAGRERRAERGSAYVVVLLVLLILTIVGLSLALITQSEMQIGANERLIQRVLYGANSGINVATARALLTNDYQPHTLTMDHYEATLDEGDGIVYQDNPIITRVQTTHFMPIQDTPCAYCEINNAGGYDEGDFRKLTFAVTSEGVRQLGEEDDGPVLARRSVTAMVDIQPWRIPVEALDALGDEEALAKIKF